MNATPIYKLSQDSKNNRIFIKRDDLIPISFGGNKARKALNFFKEIDQGNFDTVVTYGSSSSNHCRVISNMAAAEGMPCFIIMPEESSKATFNLKMMNLFGAIINAVPVKAVSKTIDHTLENLLERGKKPYFIPGGGHGNLGTAAYVDCYKEIGEFEKGNNIFFDYIFLASGTGTTQAGLVCGQLLNGDTRKIIGISIARKNPRGRKIVVDSIKDFLTEIGFEVKDEVIEEKTVFSDDYIVTGYGKSNEVIQSKITELLIKYGIPFDSTYTGKAFTGMEQYIKEHNIKNKNILFIHTGGTPLFFDDIDGF